MSYDSELSANIIDTLDLFLSPQGTDVDLRL
jgi:hypothetical protein